jgi:DNA (cytosine-5)-methyltransferase 1
MNFIDLFAGAGGFSEGLKQAGFNHIVGIENDPYAAKTYIANHSDCIIKNIEDVSREDIDGYLKGRPLDLIVASPPCQSYSLAGPRKIGDPRDGLFKEVIRIVGIYKPRYVLIENVTGMLTKVVQDKKAIDHIIDELYALGYEAEYRVLSANDYEVPQRRRRVIVVASRNKDDICFPLPITSFDASVGNCVLKRDEVPSKYFWHQRSVDYFAKKPQYAKFIDMDKPCTTIRACYKKNRGSDCSIKYSQNDIRVLTESECAAIQTFPKDYNFVGSMTRVYRQIGNAIPVNLAKHVGMALKSRSLTLLVDSSS